MEVKVGKSGERFTSLLPYFPTSSLPYFLRSPYTFPAARGGREGAERLRMNAYCWMVAEVAAEALALAGVDVVTATAFSAFTAGFSGRKP